MAVWKEEEEIDQRLRHLWNKMQSGVWSFGLYQSGLIFLLITLVIGLYEGYFESDRSVRFGLFVMMILGLIVPLYVFIWLPLSRFPFDRERLSRLVGNMYPEVGDTLLNALQIRRITPEHPFVRPALQKAYHLLLPLQLEDKVTTPPIARYLAIGLTALAIWIGVLFFAPFEGSSGLIRIVQFYRHFPIPQPFHLEAITGDLEALPGKEATLAFRVVRIDSSTSINPPITLRLAFLNRDGFETQTQVLTRDDSTGRYQFTLKSVKESFTYTAEGALPKGRLIHSDTHRVSLLNLPAIRAFQVTITPPAYSRLARQTLEPNLGDATVLKGSLLSVQLQSTVALSHARIVVDTPSPDVKSMTVKGDSAGFKWAVRSDMSYRMVLEDQWGIQSELSPRFMIRTLNDLSPEIRVMSPMSERIDLPQHLKLPIQAEIRDDFGFSKLGVYYRNSKSQYRQAQTKFTELVLPTNIGEGTETQRLFTYQLDFNRLGINEGDEVEFYLEVTDNDLVSGPKSARSASFWLRLPTLDELYKDLEEEEEKSLATLEQKIEQTLDLQRQLTALQDELRQKVSSDWQDRKAMEQGLQKQKEIESSIESLQQEIRDMMAKAEERSLFSEETLQKYDEVLKLMEQVKTPQTEAAQKSLEKALSEMNEQAMREALKNFTQNEDQLRQTLERTKELLQRMQVERKLDEMINRLERTAEKQERLQEKTRQTLSQDKQSDEMRRQEANSLAEEQQKLKEDYEAFRRQQEELKSLMDAYPKQEKMPSEQLEAFREKTNVDDVEREMANAEKNIRDSKRDDASQAQQSATQKMTAQRQALSEMKQEVSRQRKSETLEAMQQLAQSAIDLSREQESLKGNVDEPDFQAGLDEMRQKASSQQDVLEALRQMQQSLSSVGKRSSQVRKELSDLLQQAESKMESAIRQLDNRNTPSSQLEMQSAMEMLNDFAMRSMDMMAAMQNQDGQSGQGQGEGDDLGESMNSIAGQQGQLNQETQSAGERESPGRAERLAQLAAQQMALRQQLDMLRERQAQRQSQANENGQPGQKELLGSLEKMADEMEEVAKALSQNQANREVQQRQQKILTRMLESTRALQRREEEETRQARSATNIFKRSPPQLPKIPPPNPLREALNQLRDQGYSQEYERIIRRYLETLETRGTVN